MVRRIPGKGGGLLISVTRLGDLSSRQQIWATKKPKYFGDWAISRNFISLLRKKCVATFWAIFGGI